MERGMDVVETRRASRSFFPDFFLVTPFLVPLHNLCPPKAAFSRTMMSVVVHSENPAEGGQLWCSRLARDSVAPASTTVERSEFRLVSTSVERGHLARDSCRREHHRRREFQPASTTVERGEFRLVSTSVERVISRATRVAASSIIIVNYSLPRRRWLSAVDSSSFRHRSSESSRVRRAAASIIVMVVNYSRPRSPSFEPGELQVAATSVERVNSRATRVGVSGTPV
ncbi:hypothetical protein R3P38DRAFT_3435590 [Favolaschia claudopus]|uniref:Uncharacterized protein n=1 Tax=Favolaschia claudopus TaxID=2862362 RepID=A0AAV9ZU70_9AGAR